MQVWNKGIHIPDLPAWALVAGGLGAGGLYYYYKYHIRPTHAHAPALIGAHACMHACMALTRCTPYQIILASFWTELMSVIAWTLPASPNRLSHTSSWHSREQQRWLAAL